MSVVGDHYCPTEGHGVTAPGEPEPRLDGRRCRYPAWEAASDCGQPAEPAAVEDERWCAGIRAEPVDLEQRDGMVTRG